MESADDNVQQNTMLPPQPGTFKNREELITYVRNFGASQGYVLTIKNSCKDRRVIMGCDRGGVYRSRSKSEEPKRKRRAPSNCPFEVVGRKDVDDDIWLLRIKNGEHNHEPLKDMSEHRYNLRFNEEEVRLIKEMTEAGVKPRQVLETLRQTNPTLHSTPRHVYNAKARIRQGNFSERILNHGGLMQMLLLIELQREPLMAESNNCPILLVANFWKHKEMSLLML